MIKLGLIGFGHWGPNLLRNFLANKSFNVIAVADREETRLQAARLFSKDIQVVQYAEDIIQSPDIEAVAIATPATTHYALAKEAINAGKHVLVEKPLCTNSEEARDLVNRAMRKKVTLMVDHTILMTPAMQTIREICHNGELGRICYIDATRINLGLFQKDVNVLWDLAPHDFSIVDLLFKEELIEVEASGYAHLNHQMPDIAYLTLHFTSNKIAHFNMSWMSPIKMRHIVIGATQKMLVWDDLNTTSKVKIYDSGIIYPEDNENGEVILPQYRNGSVYSPKLSNREALANVVEHFAKVIAGKELSLMDGWNGLKVVQMLEKSEKALNKSLSRIQSLQKQDVLAI